MTISGPFAAASTTTPLPDTREAEAALREWNVAFIKRDDGFLEVQDLNISNQGLIKLPDLTCVVVMGYFSCSKNLLTSLAGAPQSVGETFFCYNNPLKTLAYISKTKGKVKSDFGDFPNSDAIPPELLKLSQEEIDEIIARAIAPLPNALSLKHPVIIKTRPPKKGDAAMTIFAPFTARH